MSMPPSERASLAPSDPSAGDRVPGPRPGVRLERPRTIGDILSQVALPGLALGLAAFAGWYVWRTRPVETAVAAPSTPPRSPFARTLACAGVVEPQSENIAMGAPQAGVVTEVLVKVGDAVKPGDPLFRIDDRDLRATEAVRRAAVAQAKSELVRLEAEPRPETIPPLQAAVTEADAVRDAADDALRRAEELFSKNVITEQDVIVARDKATYANAAVARTEAELTLARAGSWSYDRDVARAALDKAESDLASMAIEIDRRTIRALVPAEVLQINIRPGEFVGTPPGQPLVVIGDVDRLHVRVDIDEFEIGRFDPGARATAAPRGSPTTLYPLRFVRVEPFVVPKKSLTGDTSERVDTRVLQVIYECEPMPGDLDTRDRRLFVGQQVDVSIEATDAGAAPADPGG